MRGTPVSLTLRCLARQVTGRLDRATFHTVLMKHCPGLTEDGFIHRVHEVVDTDNDGYINFQELCLGTLHLCLWWLTMTEPLTCGGVRAGLSTVMRGSLTDKLSMLFRIYDTSGDNQISIVELVTLIRRSDTEFMHMIEFAEEVVVSLDTNGDNQISRWVLAAVSHPVHCSSQHCASCIRCRDEFAVSLQKDPVVMDIFAQCTTVPVRRCAIVSRCIHPVTSIRDTSESPSQGLSLDARVQLSAYTHTRFFASVRGGCATLPRPVDG